MQAGGMAGKIPSPVQRRPSLGTSQFGDFTYFTYLLFLFIYLFIYLFIHT